MLAFFSSFLLIVVSELADKTQLLVLSFATKYKPLKVLAGISVAALLVMLAAALIGDKLSLLLPMKYLKILAGVSFIGFGMWSLKGECECAKEKKVARFNPFMTIVIAFSLAELGDKTQLAAISLGAQYQSFFAVWLGSSFGMIVADMAAILMAIVAGKKIPEKPMRYISAGLFILFGVLVIIEGAQLFLQK